MPLAAMFGTLGCRQRDTERHRVSGERNTLVRKGGREGESVCVCVGLSIHTHIHTHTHTHTGNLGLFMGFSIMTIIEWVEFIVFFALGLPLFLLRSG